MKRTSLSATRRSMLKAASLTPVAASALLATSAHAQDRRDTLVIANEFGPNMLDIHGVGPTGRATAWRGTATTGS